jgi:hypothetical protein
MKRSPVKVCGATKLKLNGKTVCKLFLRRGKVWVKVKLSRADYEAVTWIIGAAESEVRK